MKRLAIALLLVPSLSCAQDAALKAFLSTANELEMYGELAERCTSAMKAIGKHAVSKDSDCLMLQQRKSELDDLLNKTDFGESVAHDALSYNEKVAFSAAIDKAQRAMSSVTSAFRRIGFLSR